MYVNVALTFGPRLHSTWIVPAAPVPVSPQQYASSPRGGGCHGRGADAQGSPHGWSAPPRCNRQPEGRSELRGHESIQTTGDIYTDWDVGQLADSLIEAVQDD